MPRNSIPRLRAMAAAALLSLSLAAPALADDDDWYDRDHGRRGYPVHRHDRSCDRDDRYSGGWGESRWGHGGHSGGHGYYGEQRYYGSRGHRHGDAYGCRPCGRRWSSRDPFHHHLAHDHRVPFWAFPRVVVQMGWGWAFLG